MSDGGMMYDSVNPNEIPLDASIVAGYVNGRYAWTPAGWARFPNAQHVRITISSSADADVLDVETGDATPDAAPGWVIRQRIKGGKPPTIYCSRLSAWPAVIDAFDSQHVSQPDYWIADYTGTPHLVSGSVATQWTDAGPYDISCTNGIWPAEPIAKGADMIAVTPSGNGYYVAQTNGSVFAYGDATYHGGANQGSELTAGDTITGISVRPQNDGYYLSSASGGVFAYGAAKYLGSPNAT